MTPEMIRQAGLEALRRELGVVGMVRFLQQLQPGQGDYTAERQERLKEVTGIDEIADAANKLREDPQL